MSTGAALITGAGPSQHASATQAHGRVRAVLAACVGIVALLLAGTAGAAPAPYDAGTRWMALAVLDEDLDRVGADALAAIVARDPRFASDHVNLARARLKLGESQTALEPLRAARALDPKSAPAAYLSGIALARTGATTEAAAAFAEALTLAPALPEAHFQLGVIHERAGDTKRAVAEFEAALAALPKCGMDARLAARAAHATYRHLSLLHLTAGDDAAVARADAAAFDLRLNDTPADGELDLAPSFPRLYPDAPEVRQELARAGLPAPALPVRATAVFTPAPPAIASTAAVSIARATSTTWPLELVVENASAAARSALATAVPPLDAGRVSVAADFDADGDLDIVTGGLQAGAARMVYARNAGGLTTRSAEQCGLTTDLPGAPAGLAAGDFDDDNTLDVLVFVPGRPPIALLNQRQERFARRVLNGPPCTGAGALVDVDGDGHLDVAYPAGSAIACLDRAGVVSRTALAKDDEAAHVAAADLDGDGQLDLLIGLRAGPTVLALARGTPGRPAFSFAPDRFATRPGERLTAVDLNGDGQLDLVAPGGSAWLNGAQSGVVRVSLQGTDTKAPRLGAGSKIWVRAGGRLTRRDASTSIEAIALGSATHADLVRILWTDGTVQHYLSPDLAHPETRTRVPAGSHITIHQRQGFGSSCPYLYMKRDGAWEFVTDVLAGAPLGLPSPAGGWIPTAPEELVLLPAASGRVELRVTEELREVTYLDQLELWAVDHPADVTPVPAGGMTDPQPPRLVPLRGLGAPTRARTLDGVDVTAKLAATDGTMVVPPSSAVQGLAPDNGVELTFARRPAGSQLWLVMEGMVYWTDPGINTRLAQGSPGAVRLPVLEVPDGRGGWRTALDPLPFPAGRTKLSSVDVSKYIDHDNPVVRIRTTMRLYWDRFALGEEPPPSAVPLLTIHRLTPATAACRAIPYSRLLPDPGQAPWIVDTAHPYDDLEVTWLPLRGRYTAFGPIPGLLDRFDDRYALIGPGDGVEATFVVPQATGARTLALHLAGYDKDAHPATFGSATVTPLPYRGMPAYRPGSDFPAARQRALETSLSATATRVRGTR